MKEAGIIGLEKNILSDEMGHVYFDKVLGFESSRVSDKNDSKILFFSPRRKQNVSIFELGELCSMISQFRFGDNFIASINWIFYLGDIKQYAFWRSSSVRHSKASLTNAQFSKKQLSSSTLLLGGVRKLAGG